METSDETHRARERSAGESKYIRWDRSSATKNYTDVTTQQIANSAEEKQIPNARLIVEAPESDEGGWMRKMIRYESCNTSNKSTVNLITPW